MRKGMLRKTLSLMMALILCFSGMMPQEFFTAKASAQETQPVYQGENMTISTAGDIVNLTDAYLDTLKVLTEGTISVRYRSSKSQGLSALFALSNTTPGQDNTYGVAYINPASNTVGVEIRDAVGGNYNQVSAAGAGIADDEWHTVSYVFGASVFRIYVDGKKVAEQNKSGFFSKITSPTSLKIGGLDRADRGNNQWPFQGDIDCLEVYGQALGEDTILPFHAATAFEKQVPEDPEDAVRTDQRLFYNGYENSAAYRIPSLLTTKNGTVIAAIDKRQSGAADQGNIDTVIKRSMDGGSTWQETQTLINLPAGSERHAFTIDCSMVQDQNTGRIFLFADMFPESAALMDSAALVSHSGYKEVNGKKYLILRNCPDSNSDNSYTKEYTVRENGEVWEESANTRTNYVVPEVTDGTLYEKINPGTPEETQEERGNIFLYTGANAAPLKAVRTSYLWMMTSDDDGVTWSGARDITSMVKEDWMKFIGTGPGVGIQMSDGRLVVPVYVTNDNVGASQSSAVIYSDDNGDTWAMGETVNDGVVSGGTEHMSSGAIMTESQVVEVTGANGASVLKLFCRNSAAERRVKIAASYDGGQTWEDSFQTDSTLTEPYCQLTVTAYPYAVTGYEGKQMFLFANPDSTGGRANGTLRLGYYDPDTDAFCWVASRVVESGDYAYSCVSVLGENHIGLFWEGRNLDINFSVFTLPWLMADKTPQSRVAPAVQEAAWKDGQVSVTFDQPVLAIGTPALEAVSGQTQVSLDYVSGSGTNVLNFGTDVDTSQNLEFTGIKLQEGDFCGNNENTLIPPEAFERFGLMGLVTPTLTDAAAAAGYSEIRLSFTPAPGTDVYDIYRSVYASRGFQKIGSTDTGSYVDEVGSGKLYYYQIKSQTGSESSKVFSSSVATGLFAMKQSAAISENLYGQVFDGQKVVDVSGKAAALKGMRKGSVVVKFKTADSSQTQEMFLMAKPAGKAVNVYGGNDKAAIYLQKSGSDMGYRADLAHTRAGVAGSLADGNWHTVVFSSDTAADGKALRYTIDGEEKASFTGAANTGFFSTVPELTEVTIGGCYGADKNTVLNGFKGEIAYVVVTDEVLTDAEAVELSAVPEIISAVPGYASVKLQFLPCAGVSNYDIYRSETADGVYAKIGSSANGTYTDHTGTGKRYYYQVRNAEGTLVSESTANETVTGEEAMKANAALYQDTSQVKFDGAAAVDVSDRAAALKSLEQGSVVVKFRTTDKSQAQEMLLMAKPAGKAVSVYGGNDKAGIYLQESSGAMGFRADLAHTRAGVKDNLADGNWHTVVFSSNKAVDGKALRYTIDGEEKMSFTGAANTGFFSTVPELTEVTIGGCYGADKNTVQNGFQGEIAYLAVTNEVFTDEEAIELSKTENLELTSVTPGYSSIRMNFTSLGEGSSYEVYRSGSENGIYEKIGTTSDTSYVDPVGLGKSYFYQIKSKGLESKCVGTTMPTGIEAMKQNAVVYKDTRNVKFDGTALVDVSDKASSVGTMEKGSVIFRFKTTDKTASAAILMAKTAGESPNLENAGNNAAMLLQKAGNQMRIRANFQHTRAAVLQDYADGEWHTAIIINDVSSTGTLRFTVDGRQEAVFDAGANNGNVGFFSTVQNLNELTIGGYHDGNSAEVSGGFRGELAYVAVTDEVFTTQEANAITNRENGIICDISSQMFDQSKDNTWVFSGGADVEGGYEETQGIRNYMGQFEEYVRYTKNGGTMGRQRYTINTGKSGRTLSEVNEKFSGLVEAYDPKALAVLVGQEDYQAGEAGVETMKGTLNALVKKAMGLRNGTGYLVIQTPYAQKDAARQSLAQAYAAAVEEVYDSLTEVQKEKVIVVNHFVQTNHDEFKNKCLNESGRLNAYGHLEIAKELSDAVYGTTSGFPVSDASFSLVKTKTPSKYLDAAPEVRAESGKLTISVPSQTGAEEWKYDLESDGQTTSGAVAGETVVTGLAAGAEYTLTVTSKDGEIRLAVVTGKVAEGNVPVKKPSVQTGLNDLQKEIKAVVEGQDPAAWLFVGDSITHGAFHTNGYDSIHQIFEKYLKDELGRKDDVVINTAVSGATSREQESNSKERLDKYNADVVVVMLGTNDASNQVVPPEEYRRNLECIVDKIHAKGAVAVMRTPNPLRPENGSRATNLPEYAQIIRETAAAKNAILVDHFAEWSEELESRTYLWNNGYWNNDSIHPNPNGQLNMAQSLIRGMGLFNETSAICSLSYELPVTKENSALKVNAKGNGTEITADIKTLETSYQGEFGAVELKAECEGVTYAVSGDAGTEALTLHRLPAGGSFKVSVTASLKDSGKIVSFASETVELEAEKELFRVVFLGKDGQVLKEEEVEKGKDATAPTAPEVEGWKFVKWDKDYTNVQSNLEVKAVYEESDPAPVPVDKTALEKEIKLAETKNQGEYTKESWDIFAAAWKEAQGVMGNQEAVQAEVDEAVKALQRAIDGLVKTGTGQPGDIPSDGNGEDGSGGNGGTDENTGNDNFLEIREGTVVSADVLSAVKGKDKKIVLTLKNGMKWTIDGKSIQEGSLKDIDLNVMMNTDVIPDELVKAVAGGNTAIQLSLVHDGELGFTAILTIPLGKEYSGQFANLYYYNESTKELKLEEHANVDADGNVELTFNHASDYVIVLDSKAHTAPKTGDTSPISGLIILLSAAAMLGAETVRRKKAIR